MSLHHPTNKPRSLHRQLSTPHAITNTSSINTLGPIPSSLEHHVDQWPNRTSNSNSSSRRHSVSSEKSNDLGLNGNGDGQSFGLMAPATKRPLCHVKTQSTTTPFLTEEGKKMTGPTTHCPCCQLPDCYSWKTTTKTIQKLEMETQLAAEIGQSLLQKNEEYMANLDDLKNRLKLYQDRNEELTLSLDDSERLAQRLNREKDKWMWQYEKSEQILNESIADLETTNDKCAALTKDLEETKLEMEKLQQFKHKSHQFDTREDNLQSKLEDTKQELMISRKNELGWEMKYKKLVTRYEALSYSHQDLCKRTSGTNTNIKLTKPLSSMTSPTVSDIQQASTDELVTFIKELVSTNNGLKSELLDTTTRLDDIRQDMNALQAKQQIDQTRLNKDIKSKGQSSHNSNSNHLADHSDGVRQSISKRNSSDDTKTATNSRRHRSASARLPRSKTTRESIKTSSSRPSVPNKNSNKVPTPQATTSTPVVHHHYHYYLRQQQCEGDNKSTLTGDDNHDNVISRLCSDKNCTDISPTNLPEILIPPNLLPPDLSTFNHNNNNNNNNKQESLSPSTVHNIDSIQHYHHHQPDPDSFGNANYSVTHTPSELSSSTTTKPDALLKDHPISVENEITLTPSASTNSGNQRTPYSTLYEQATTILQRLRSTDARTLNRRLHRAFDIVELNNMSNLILQNLVTDVEMMDARFLWLTPDENDQDDSIKCANERPISSLFLVDEFFPLLRLLQELLQEIGQLSITINHLQVEYVKKVEENKTRVEQEVWGKHQSSISGKSSMTPSLVPSTSTSTPASFISLSSNSIHSILSAAGQQSNNTNNSINNPVHWISALFTATDKNKNKNNNTNTAVSSSSLPADTHNDVNTVTRSTTMTLPTAVSTLDHNRQTGELYAHKTRRFTRRRNNRRGTRLDQHRQSISTSSTHRFWPSLSLILNEWSHLTTMKQSSSSSLDREWLWTCSDDGLSSASSHWLRNND